MAPPVLILPVTGQYALPPAPLEAWAAARWAKAAWGIIDSRIDAEGSVVALHFQSTRRRPMAQSLTAQLSASVPSCWSPAFFK